MSRMRKETGFTLIELLVVISIIGLLSSVVLASLNSARIKGKDAAVKSGLVQLRSQIALYASGIDGNLSGSNISTCAGGFFGTDTKINSIIVGIIANSSKPTDTPGTSNCNYNATSNLWAVQFYLSSQTPTWVACLDSSGIIKEQAFVNNAVACS